MEEKFILLYSQDELYEAENPDYDEDYDGNDELKYQKFTEYYCPKVTVLGNDEKELATFK